MQCSWALMRCRHHHYHPRHHHHRHHHRTSPSCGSLRCLKCGSEGTWHRFIRGKRPIRRQLRRHIRGKIADLHRAHIDGDDDSKTDTDDETLMNAEGEEASDNLANMLLSSLWRKSKAPNWSARWHGGRSRLVPKARFSRR